MREYAIVDAPWPVSGPLPKTHLVKTMTDGGSFGRTTCGKRALTRRGWFFYCGGPEAVTCAICRTHLDPATKPIPSGGEAEAPNPTGSVVSPVPVEGGRDA